MTTTYQFRHLACVLLVLATSALGGCSMLEGMQRPTARISGMALQDINLQSATLLFDVDVDNPYDVALPMSNLDYSLASEGAAFLSGKAQMQGTVPARGTKRMQLPAKVTYLELLKVLKGVRPGSVVPYVAEMGLSVNAPVVGEMRLPMKKEGKLPVPAPPSVEVSEVAWGKVDLNQATGTVRLKLSNPNQFPLDLSRINYALALGDVEVAKSQLAKPLALPASGGNGQVEIPLSFSPAKAGLGFLKTLTGSGGGYSLKGDITAGTPYGPITLPMERVGNTVFRR